MKYNQRHPGKLGELKKKKKTLFAVDIEIAGINPLLCFLTRNADVILGTVVVILQP